MFWRSARDRDQDFQRELRSHLAAEADEQLERGLTYEEAEYSAKRALGNSTLIRENVREVWSYNVMERSSRDLRYFIRAFLKSPGFSAVAILTLALGLGVNVAVFSVVDAVLLRPLPYPGSEHLVYLSESHPQLNDMSVALPNYFDWRDQNKTFERLAARRRGDGVLTGAGEPERLGIAEVTSNFFSTLGVEPTIGRAFSAAEDSPGGARVAIISERFWARRFGREPNVLGQTLNLDGQAYTVIGVMPRGFHYPITDTTGDVWIPLGVRADQPRFSGRDDHAGTYCVGRLKPGVTIGEARADMTSLSRRLAEQYPASNKDQGAYLQLLQDRAVRNIRQELLIISAAVAFVLLLVCVNMSNLLLSRATARQHEVSLRRALGAGTLELIRQFVTESMALSFIGGVVGVLLAIWSVPSLVTLLPPDLPVADSVAVNGRVLAFAALLCALTGAVFGVLPAWQQVFGQASDVIRGGGSRVTGGRRGQHTRGILIVGEVAVSLILLVAAALMIRSFSNLTAASLGFRADHVITMSVSLPPTRYKTQEQWARFHEDVLRGLRDIPQVKEAALATPLLLTGEGMQAGFRRDSWAPSRESITTDVVYVTPTYFQTMGIPLRRGRSFDAHDQLKTQRVVLIDEAFSQSYFPNEDPIGKRLLIGTDESGPRPWEIIGVVANVKTNGPDQESRIETYFPLTQRSMSSVSLVARTVVGESLALKESIEQKIRAIDPNLPVYDVTSLSALLADSFARKRAATILLGILGVAALTLAAIGLFGVMSYLVAQRTNEIGIRIAVGAGRVDLLRLILGRGMFLTGLGVALGALCAVGSTRLLSTLLFGVSPLDPISFTGATLVLALVAMLASYIPARRAMRVDPIIALRHD